MEQLHARYVELYEKVDQRKRLKTNGGHTNGNNASGGVGRGERLNAAQRERMRLLTTAAFDRGKGEDTFGARDEDWQLYKLMSKDNDDEDDGPDEDESELVRISSRLQVILFLIIIAISGDAQIYYSDLCLVVTAAGNRSNFCSEVRSWDLSIC